MKNIAIIGAGQLGSRHLQSLADLKNPSNIFVIDPSVEAINTAIQRYIEVSQKDQNVLHYFHSLEQLPSQLDLAIIATNSISRAKIIQSLLNKSEVQNLILEKVLFPSLLDYDDIEKLFSSKGTKVWVNCPRRTFDYYTFLKNEIKESFTMEVIGNNWGLASNTIHFLDVFSYLVDDADIVIESENLDNKIIQSKRSGYIEFTGSLSFRAGKSSITISSFDKEASLPTIQISSKDSKYTIVESGSHPRIECEINGEIKWVKDIKVPYQSQLTSVVVEDIFKMNNCCLTPFNLSCKIHRLLIETLLQKQRQIMNDDTISLCPIT